MKLRALIMDDSRVMRNMVMDALRRTKLAEFEFTEAANGVEGLDKFDPRMIDIAFIDWNMPKMSGIDFVREVRTMKDCDHIPLVMITSEKTMGKIEEALNEAGADAFISKPFTVKELQWKLGKVIEKMSGKQKKKSSGFFNKLRKGA